MKNILVPIGTSPHSHETLQYAIDFAAEFSAKVYAMEVFTAMKGTGTLTDISKKIAEKSAERLREVIAKVDTKGTEIAIATYNGDLVDGLNDINEELGIDLIIIAARSNDIREELFLGPTTGRILRNTEIPMLIVPKGNTFAPYRRILTAFASGIVKRRKALEPLNIIQEKFEAMGTLLLVKTPGYTEDDLRINTFLMDLSSEIIITEQTTTYLGVLEYLQAKDPDLLCVFRRRRGFFKKLIQKNSVPKSEFSSRIPVLVLSAKKD